MIIRPKRSAGLFMALIIEFIMIPFYIYAASLKMFLVEMGIVQILVCRNIFLTFPILQAFQPIH